MVWLWYSCGCDGRGQDSAGASSNAGVSSNKHLKSNQTIIKLI